MTIRIFRNTAPNAPKLAIKRLPIHQHLIWFGPIFILIQRSVNHGK